MVPSMSEMTMCAVDGQRKRRADVDVGVEVEVVVVVVGEESEKVMLFAPGLRSSCLSWSEVSRRVLAYRFVAVVVVVVVELN